MSSVGVMVGATVAIILVLVSLAVVYSRMMPAGPLGRSVLLSLATGAAGSVPWLAIAPFVAPHLTGGLYVPIAALGAAASFLATITVRSVGAPVAAALGFAAAWSTLVFVPVAIVSFSASGMFGLEPTDHGGSLPLNVASGAAALGVLLASRARLSRTVQLSRVLGVVSVLALCAGWLAWLVGAELAVDGVSGLILINGLAGSVGGIAGWLAVQRISHQSTTLTAVAAGAVSGLVAVTAGAPLFTPVSATAAGVIAGGFACLFTLRRVGASRRQQWFLVGSHLVAGGIGLVLLGILATLSGFLFTGQVAFVGRQLVATVVVTAWSATISFALWRAVELLLRLRVTSPA